MNTKVQNASQPQQSTIFGGLTDRAYHSAKILETIGTRTAYLGLGVLSEAASILTLRNWDSATTAAQDYLHGAFNYDDLSLHATGIINPEIVKKISKVDEYEKRQNLPKIEEQPAAPVERERTTASPTFSTTEAIEKTTKWVTGKAASVGTGALNYGLQGRLRKEFIDSAMALEFHLLGLLNPLVCGYNSVPGTDSEWLKEVQDAAQKYRSTMQNHANEHFSRLADRAAGTEHPLKWIRDHRSDALLALQKQYENALRPVINSYLQRVQKASIKNLVLSVARAEGRSEPSEETLSYLYGSNSSIFEGVEKSKQSVQADVNDVLNFYRRRTIDHFQFPNQKSYPKRLSSEIDEVMNTLDKEISYVEIFNAVKELNYKYLLEPFDEESQEQINCLLDKIEINRERPGFANYLDNVAERFLVEANLNRETNNEFSPEILKRALRKLANYEKAIVLDTGFLMPAMEKSAGFALKMLDLLDTIIPVKCKDTGSNLGKLAFDKAQSLSKKFLAITEGLGGNTALSLLSSALQTDAMSNTREIPEFGKIGFKEVSRTFARRTSQILATTVFSFVTLLAAKLLSKGVTNIIPGVGILSAPLPNDLNGLTWTSLSLGAFYHLPRLRRYIAYGGAAIYGIQYYTPFGMLTPTGAVTSTVSWTLSLAGRVVEIALYTPTVVKVTVLYSVIGGYIYQKAKSPCLSAKKVVWDGLVVKAGIPTYNLTKKAYKWLKRR